MDKRQDTEQLLCKLNTITSIPELNEFRDGLTRYDHREPPAEVVHAVARKRVELEGLK